MDDDAGGSRTGVVALVLPPLPGQGKPAGAYIGWDEPEGGQPESVRWSIDHTVAASGRARLAIQTRTDEQIAKSNISEAEIMVACEGDEIVVIDNFGGVAYSVQRSRLFEHGGGLVSMWRKDKSGKLSH